MYSRNFRPAQQRTEGNVPVQYFEDSFSADTFGVTKKAKETEMKMPEATEGLSIEKTIAPKDTARKIDIEDLLLIGMLLLFSTDIKDKEDLLIPIILGAILFF